MTVSQPDVCRVKKGELAKMKYLISAIRCADEMLQHFKPWRESVIMTESVDTEVRIDWRTVVIHCMPQVMVVLNHDKRGNDFYDYPLYAILPESDQVLPLSDVKSLSVEVLDEDVSEVEAHGALQTLLTYAQSIDSGKRENVLRQLHTVQRVLR